MAILLRWCLVVCLLTVNAVAGGSVSLTAESLAPIAEVVQAEIEAGHIPGAVVLVGQGERIVYRRAFGERVPGREPMTLDTVFDVASLTKPVITTTAVLQLVEHGKLKLDAPVARYWPAFGRNGKAAITIRELLTHTSGLPAGLRANCCRRRGDVFQRIVRQPGATAAARAKVVYSDLNFIVLGVVVARVSGLPLDRYAERHLIRPLGLVDSSYRPGSALWPRIAPSHPSPTLADRALVHDPLARRLGGVAGNAGLFSTADDLARFARMLLAGGRLDGVRLLTADPVAQLPVPATRPEQGTLRALGWKVELPFAQNRASLLPYGAIGHTGYSGVGLWLDPSADTYVIVLTNRTLLRRGNAGIVRQGVVDVVAIALGLRTEAEVLANQPWLATYHREVAKAVPSAKVSTGLEQWAARGFAELVGKRVGLVLNHSSRDRAGRSSLTLLRQSPRVEVVALFSPEHGLEGKLDRPVASGVEPEAKLPVHSLYGDVRKPTPAMLAGIDALVFDLQDAGVRFYTYIATLGDVLEAAAAAKLPVYVLDRPNPLNGLRVEGPVLDPAKRSFTGYFPLPTRHGLTVGELAQLFNIEDRIGAELHVIPMVGWVRADWFEQTGLDWPVPSPNLRNLIGTTLYPGVAWIEGANVSVGRGTELPFEQLGAPWLDGERLASALNARAIPGVHFTPTQFTPTENRFADEQCQGVRIELTDREALDTARLGLELIVALYRQHPQEFQLQRTAEILAADWIVEAVARGESVEAIMARWQPALAQFKAMRERYLLYPEWSDYGAPRSH